MLQLSVLKFLDSVPPRVMQSVLKCIVCTTAETKSFWYFYFREASKQRAAVQRFATGKIRQTRFMWR